MNKQHFFFSLIIVTVCIGFFATCHKKEPDKAPVIDDFCYTNVIQSFTNTNVQIGDTIYHLNCMEGSYCYNSTLNKNVFYFSLSDSSEYFLYNYNPVSVRVLTEAMKPEIFFQKGVIQIDTMHIHNDPVINGGSMYSQYYAIRAVFTWDSVSYENRSFKGKGSLETLDTLYTDYQDTSRCPNTYYPPQKIEFEFK